MRVTVLQLPALFGQPQLQLERVEAALTAGPRTDLVLLPEASLGGYLHEQLSHPSAPLAEALEGPTLRALEALARRHGCHVVGPLIERDGARTFNAMVGVDPAGERFLHYRKRNPWYPESWATPGDLPWPRARVHGRTLTAAICFDVHFLEEDPEASAALSDAELLLFPSAWCDAHDSLPEKLEGLSRRFDLDVVNANWGFGRPALRGQGGSMIFGRGGRLHARLGPEDGLRLDVEL